MSEMVDRVILVLAKSGAGCAFAAVAQSAAACPYKVCRCRAAAIDMIAAMREPTRAMAMEGVAASRSAWASPADLWRAMIDALLKETGTDG